MTDSPAPSRASSPATSTCAAEHVLELPGWSARRTWDRPRARTRAVRLAARDLAGRSTASEWRGALGPCSRGGDDRVTLAEARALFPVLERVAYLNAGTFGPLATPTFEAVEGQLRADFEQGRLGKEYFERMLQLRVDVRAALAALVGAEPEQVSLTGSTTDGCNIVLGGLGLGPEDEVVTTAEEHFGLIGPLHASGARVVVVAPEAEAVLAAVTPRTKLIAVSQVLWTTGRVLPVHDLRERSEIPVLVDGAQSVGAIPVDARGFDFLTISGQKWLCGPDATGALVIADPDRLRVARPELLLPGRLRADRRVRARRRGSALRPGVDLLGVPRRPAHGARPAPDWAYERAAEQARRCRELLAGRVEVVRSRGRDARRLRAGRPAATRRAARGGRRRRPRDCPAPGLVRVAAAGGRATTTSSGCSLKLENSHVRCYADCSKLHRRAWVCVGSSPPRPRDARFSRCRHAAATGESFFVGFSEDLPEGDRRRRGRTGRQARRQGLPADDALVTGPDPTRAGERRRSSIERPPPRTVSGSCSRSTPTRGRRRRRLAPDARRTAATSARSLAAIPRSATS